MAKAAAKKQRSLPTARPFRIGFLVHDVSRMRKTLFDRSMKSRGLTRSQWWVLANLSRQPDEGVMQTELARLMDVGKVTVGGLIDRLEASGLVERRPSVTDRRAKRIFITTKGYRAIEQMSDAGNELNDIILEGIPHSHIRTTEDVLHTIKENIKKHLNGDIPDDDDEDDV